VIPDYPPRPKFATPGEFVQHYIDCRARGQEPWPPETKAELMALNDVWPELARFHRPPKPFDRDLPAWFGKVPEPYDEFERKRLLKTVQENKTFARALVVLLREAALDE
jgi:hypothetical protein